MQRGTSEEVEFANTALLISDFKFKPQGNKTLISESRRMECNLHSYHNIKKENSSCLQIPLGKLLVQTILLYQNEGSLEANQH